MADRLSTLLYRAAFAAVLLQAALFRFGIPQQPFLDGDAWGYLRPAISQLTTGVFSHHFGRDSLYPAFVYGVLKLTGDLRALCVTQHILGLVTGGLMTLAWAELCRLQRPGPVPLLPRLTGLLPVIAFLNSTSTWQLEHSLRPEAVFPLFVIGSLWLNLAFIRRRWREPGAPLAAAWRGAAALVLAVICYKLKPAFGIAALVAAAPALFSLVRPGMIGRWKAAMAIAAALGAAALILPESALKKRDPVSATFLPDTLFAIHADMIADQLSRDLADNVAAPYPRELLLKVRDGLTLNLTIARQPAQDPYASLGFNPDYLMYTNNVFNALTAWTPEGRRERVGVELYCYRRAALQQPWRMARKIVRQLRKFYWPDFAHGSRATNISGVKLRSFYAANAEHLGNAFGDETPSLLQGYPPAQALRAASERLAGAAPPVRGSSLAHGVGALLSRLYLAGLLASLVVGVWALSDRRRRAEWLLPTALVFLIYGYNFGNTLTISIVHTLDIRRYTASQFAYTMFASAAGLLYVGETWRRFKLRA